MRSWMVVVVCVCDMLGVQGVSRVFVEERKVGGHLALVCACGVSLRWLLFGMRLRVYSLQVLVREVAVAWRMPKESQGVYSRCKVRGYRSRSLNMRPALIIAPNILVSRRKRGSRRRPRPQAGTKKRALPTKKLRKLEERSYIQ